jgi:hypothetical protein
VGAELHNVSAFIFWRRRGQPSSSVLDVESQKIHMFGAYADGAEPQHFGSRLSRPAHPAQFGAVEVGADMEKFGAEGVGAVVCDLNKI